MEKSAKERLCEKLGRIDTLLDMKYGHGRYGSIAPEACEEYAMLSRIALKAYAQSLMDTKNGMGSD